MSDLSHCAVHDTDEQVDERTYLVCFECSHVYETPEDLEREWQRTYPLDFGQRTAEQIVFCPLCLHDF